METDLSAKTYVVTGATSGIGLATAEALVRRGASLIGVGRSAERCREAERRLRSLCPLGAVDYLVADLSVQKEVISLAERIAALLAARGKPALPGMSSRDEGAGRILPERRSWRDISGRALPGGSSWEDSPGRTPSEELSLEDSHERTSGQCGTARDGMGRCETGQDAAGWCKTVPGGLDGLVNNAGVFTYWLALTADGVETQWAVNHLAPFLLTQRLLPLLQAAPFARVVTVSSDSHYGARIHWDDPQLRRRYNGLSAYGTTKLANILFTRELNRRLGTGSTVRAFAADPGLVKTDIGMKGTPALAGWVWKLRRSGGISAEESARGIAYLLTEPSIQEAPEIYWKHGHPRRTSREAEDSEQARRLWELSAQLCGLREEAPHVAA